MASINIDFIAGRVQSERDAEGWIRVERCGRVTNVAGFGYQKHLNALKVSGMPQVGDVHPAIEDMEVKRHRFDTISDSIVDVYPIYERVDPFEDGVQVTGSSYTMDVETNRDANGTLLETEFGGKKQGGTVIIPVGGYRWNVTKRTEIEPDVDAGIFVGTYNSGTWTLGGQTVTPTAAGKWKCVSWDWASPDNGKTWESIIVIERAPFYPDGTISFDQEYVYLDPETGRIPDGVIDGSAGVQALAVKTFTPFPLTDFTGMGL